MFPFGKAKKVVNLVMEDYVVRMVENNGKDLSSITTLAEKAIPANLIVNGKIIDDVNFELFMKELVEAWQIKGKSVRFYVPNALVIMRDITITDPVIPTELKQYITMEIGHRIHFPFDYPIFAIYKQSGTETVDQVTLLAAPEKELKKYTAIFEESGLKPIAVDVEALGNYRYFFEHGISDMENVYLFLQLNMTSTTISIFRKHHLEFLRYESFNLSNHDWQLSDQEEVDWTYAGDEEVITELITNQIEEIERIMNFYQYSLHQGNEAVTELVLLGDLPNLEQVKQALKKQYSLPVQIMSTEASDSVSPAFIPALGLAIKGGKANGA